VLLDRERELDKLVEFATGLEGYRWLVGGPWAGKTGLVAHFLGSVPAGVDVVAYFLVRRGGSDNSDRFLSEANDQLARLLGEDTRVQQNDLGVTWQSLWQRAVDQAERTGRHLLLVVDGLDEDLSRSRGLPSVASLLPTLVGARAHVLVTSRPNPGVPSDVDIDHPLRKTSLSPLEPSRHARAIEARAYQELDQVLRHRGETGGKVGRARRVLSLLAAAEGPLSLRDLADLTGAKTWKVEDTVEDQLARLVQPSVQGQLPRLMFAHETLRESATGLFAGRELEQARQRILDWAADQAAAGWSIDETPDYLLDSYPDLLTRHEPDRLGVLTRDIAYLEAACGRVGIDYVASLLRSAVNPSDDAAATTLWVLDREAHNLRGWYPQSDRTRFASQVRNRAVELGVSHLAAAADARLVHLGVAHLALVWRAGVVSANLERTLLGHDFGSVSALALTHGGRRLISGGQDGALRVWDLETGRQLCVRQGHPYGITKVVAGADGRMAVSLSGDGGARVWDLEASGELMALEEVDDVEMTPEGWLFVALRSGVVEQRRPGTAELARRLTGGDHPLPRLGASGSTVLAVNAGGGRVAAGYPNGAISVWDLDTGEARERLGLGPVSALAFDPGGHLLVLGFATGAAQVWDLGPGGDARALKGHDDAVVGVVVANDARTAVTISIDGILTSWDLGSGKILNTVAADRAYQRGHGHPPLTLSSDGQLAVGALGWQSLTVMETRAGGSVRLLRGHAHAVWAAAMTPDDRRVVSGSGDGSIQLWNLTSDRASAGLTGHSMGVEAVAISPGGEVAISGSTDGVLKVWEVRNGKQRCAFVAHDASIEGVAIDSAGSSGATVGLDSTIRMWDLQKGTQKAVLETDRSWEAVGIADNGALALVAGNGAVMVWGDAGIQELRSGHRSNGIVLPCAVSQGGGSVIWTTSDGRPGFTVLDVASGTSHAVVTDHSPQSVAVGPDGRFAAAGLTDATVGVWTVDDQTEIARLVGHAYLVRAVAVGADGRHVVSGAGDRTIRAWRTRAAQGPADSGEQAVAAAALDSGVSSVAASSDGSTIVVGETSGAVSCFRLVLPGPP
jgi:WD40 repeat protein